MRAWILLKGDGTGKQDEKVNYQTWLKKTHQRRVDRREQAVTRACKKKAGKGRNSAEETSKTLNAHPRGECSVPTCRKEEWTVRVTFNCHSKSKEHSNVKMKER